MLAEFESLLWLHLGSSAQFYEWSCSSLDSTRNGYTLPDLDYGDAEGVAGDRDRVVRSNSSWVDVFSVPSALNCSGTVMALDYCYAGWPDQETKVFTVLTLKQVNLTFKITNKINVHVNSLTNCYSRDTEQKPPFYYCCESLSLNITEQFHLPASNFALAIVPATSVIRQLRHRVEFFPEYRVEQYNFSKSDLNALAVGDNFTLTSADRTVEMALGFFKFEISKLTLYMKKLSS